MGVPLNTDLSANYWVPIVAIQLQLAGLGGNLVNFTKRVVIWGHKTSAGTARPGFPYALVTQALANSLFGVTSDIAAQYAHLAAQNAASAGAGIEAWGIAVADPSGASATHLIKIIALPTDAHTAGVNTSAQAAGYADVYVAGWKFTINIASGDLFATIASAIADEITTRIAAAQGPFNCPISTAIAAGATVTITANHIGQLGIELPIRVDFNSDALGLAASPGTLTYATTAGANGSTTVSVGSESTGSITIINGDTIDVIVDHVVDAIEALPFNVRALDNHPGVAGQVVLLYTRERVAHRISAITSGVGVATTVTAAVGTAGSGVPLTANLTDAFTRLRGVAAFRLWLVPWTDTATLNSFLSHITEMASGLNMKGQVVFLGDTRDLVTAGAIPTATTPRLTTTPRFAVGWCPDSEIRGCELMAHAAGAVLADDYVAANYDGMPLRTTGNVPLGVPHLAVRPDPSTVCNTAIVTFHLTPFVVTDDGEFTIQRGTTTVSAATDELTNWGVIFGLDYARAYAVGKLRERFLKPRKNLKRHGVPQSERTVNPESVGDCIGEILDDLEQGANGAQADIVDGADELKKLIKFQSNPLVSGRVDATFPIRIPVPLHQVSVVEQHLPG